MNLDHAPSHERQFDGAACRLARERLGWSAEQLAQASGLAALTIVGFETGYRTPRAGTLIAIRRALRTHGVIHPRPFAEPLEVQA
jgi:transcriptional regulator with XRE-family HTH domain